MSSSFYLCGRCKKTYGMTRTLRKNATFFQENGIWKARFVRPCCGIEHEMAADRFAPDADTLMIEANEGICQTLDGCIIEEMDGHCPHTYPTWLLVLGMV